MYVTEVAVLVVPLAAGLVADAAAGWWAGLVALLVAGAAMGWWAITRIGDAGVTPGPR